MKNSEKSQQSKYGDKLDVFPSKNFISSPLNQNSPGIQKETTLRKKTRTRSQLRKLKTEDFSIRRKLMNQSCFGKIKVLLKSIQQYIYVLLEDPASSLLALIIQYCLLFSILLSCAAIICDSIIDQDNQEYQEFANYLELYLFTFFGMEYLLRLISCNAFDNSLVKFVVTPMNIIDLVAILPFILSITMDSTSLQQLRVIRMVRFLRIFRLFKVSRIVKDMMLLADTVRNSAKDIGILLAILGLFVLFFATMIYYAESNQDNGEEESIKSIGEGIWWCITTMTTVGYGDKVPITIQGKFIACITALFGITSISLPVAVMQMNLTNTLRNQEENIQIQNLKEEFSKKTDNDPMKRSKHGGLSDQTLNLKELAFMEERLKQLFENNQVRVSIAIKMMLEQVEKSQLLFDEVTYCLMSLYTALAEEMDLHLEEKLKKLTAKRRIMKMEKTMTQKRSIDLNQIVSVYKEKQRMMSQMSVLNCEESVQEGSVYSRKQSGQSSINYSRKQSRLQSRFPFGSQQEVKNSFFEVKQEEKANNSLFLGGNNTVRQDSVFDNLRNAEFQFDLQQGDGEIDEDDDCDLQSKMRSLSVASEKFKRINSIRK